MNKLEIDNFKKQLQTMRSELDDLESTSKASAATVILDQASVGRLSRMDAMQGQQMALECERRRKEQLLQIKAALNRIDKDTFGYCSVCEIEIAMGRLAINPTVTRCVGCAE
jgi:RNA polymerase-binding transcription factor